MEIMNDVEHVPVGSCVQLETLLMKLIYTGHVRGNDPHTETLVLEVDGVDQLLHFQYKEIFRTFCMLEQETEKPALPVDWNVNATSFRPSPIIVTNRADVRKRKRGRRGGRRVRAAREAAIANAARRREKRQVMLSSFLPRMSV